MLAYSGGGGGVSLGTVEHAAARYFWRGSVTSLLKARSVLAFTTVGRFVFAGFPPYLATFPGGAKYCTVKHTTVCGLRFSIFFCPKKSRLLSKTVGECSRKFVAALKRAGFSARVHGLERVYCTLLKHRSNNVFFSLFVYFVKQNVRKV